MNKNTGKYYPYTRRQKPEKINGQTATRTYYYSRELTKIVKSIFNIKCPLDWDLDYMKRNLIKSGYFIISQTKSAGVLPIWGSLAGLNYIGQPTRAIMSSPILGNWQNTIDEDCVIIYVERIVNNVFYNFQTKIDITAEKLASADRSIDINLMNSNLAYVIEAESKAQADSIKAMYDEITEGNPLVVYKKDVIQNAVSGGLKAFFGNVKNNYIANDVHQTKRDIMYEFLTSIGINNANTDKRERLITDEVNANNEELNANTKHWKEVLEIQNKKVKKVFPELEFSISLDYGGVEDAVNRLIGDMGDKTSEK